MGRKQNVRRDPEKRAAKRRARAEAIARGSVINPRQERGAPAPPASKKAKQGAASLEAERP